MVRTKSIGGKVSNGVILGGLILLSVISLYPVWHTIAFSFSDSASAAGNLVYLLPVHFNFESYIKIINDGKFFRAAGISVERVLLGGTVQFLLTSMMAFALSRQRKDFRTRDIYMWFLVFTMMFSGGLIPTYMNIGKMGLMNSIWALVLPSAVPVYNIILLMNFFRNIPKEMDQAAYIDGAGPWYLLIKIYLPISLPALATVTLFSVVGHWNAFFDGLIYMNKTSQYPLATYIQSMVIPTSFANMSAKEIEQWAKISDKTFNAAKIFVCMIPILAVYPFLQRYFIHGIMLGSIKE
jgi:putative aldouronate transport system permease protein